MKKPIKIYVDLNDDYPYSAYNDNKVDEGFFDPKDLPIYIDYDTVILAMEAIEFRTILTLNSNEESNPKAILNQVIKIAQKSKLSNNDE